MKRGGSCDTPICAISRSFECCEGIRRGAVRDETKTQVAHGSVKACRRHVAWVVRAGGTAGLCDGNNDGPEVPWQLPDRAVEVQTEIDAAIPISLVGDIVLFAELYDGCGEPDLFFAKRSAALRVTTHTKAGQEPRLASNRAV